ncbi:DUF4214 domain-containing protein [Caulobacter sp. CCG-8]|uniref:DUF4214 domain-containing protein n=1 Tax=Caulobacter sp. CCG-8 TaxID=3127958 RepID=UPI00307F1EAF
MSVYQTHKLSAQDYQSQLKALIKAKESLKGRISHAAGSAKVDFAFGYDISSRRNNAQSIIDDFTAPEVGIALSAAQKKAILDWGAGLVSTDAMIAAVNPASGDLVTPAQADALLGRSLSQYDATFLSKIQTIDNNYSLGGALVAQFNTGSVEKIQLMSKAYNSGTIYSALAKPLTTNDVAEFAVQMAWMYSSVHDGNSGKYSAGLQIRFQESAQAIINARLSDPAIYPNGATATDRAAMATALLSRVVANASLISAGIKGMDADKFSSKTAIDNVKNGFQTFVDGLVNDLGGGFQMKSNLGVLTLVVQPNSTPRTVSQWANLLGVPETALEIANPALFHGDTLAAGSFKMPDQTARTTAARMDQMVQADPAKAPANRAQFDALKTMAVASFKTAPPPHCFAAGTPVLMADGSERAIEMLQVGDLVMAFDGLGPLEARRVEQLHVNTTERFLLIDGRTLITPGHYVLTEDGSFDRVEDVLEAGRRLVDVSGVVRSVDWREVSVANHLSGTSGAPVDLEVWATYNLTVEGLHTYVAGGLRVHNDSAQELMALLGATIIDEGSYNPSTGVYSNVKGQTADGVIITMNAADVNLDGITDAISYTALYKNGTKQVFKLKGGKGDYGGKSIDLSADYNWKLVYPAQMSAILSTIGSSLGNIIGNGDPLASVAASTLLSSIGGTVGALVDGSLTLDASQSFLQRANTVAGSISSNLAQAFQGAAIGSVSSALTLQLGNALGLSGFGAEIFQTTGATVLGTLLNNATDMVNHVAGANLLNGFSTTDLWGNAASLDASKLDPQAWKGGALSSAIGSYLGAKLGSMIVSPQTQAGVALSSIASSVGAYMFSAAGAASAGAIGTWAATLAASMGHLGDFVVPGLGSLIGFVLGALIGNLFGKKKPKIPTASAYVDLQIPYAHYALGAISVANGGNRDLVTSMATSARDTLNSLIGMVAYDDDQTYVSNLNGVTTTQTYGHTGNQIYVKINGAQTNVASADEAVDLGVLAAIRNTKIVGGNLFLKRAIALSHATNLQVMAGDLQVAADYVDYLANRVAINGAMAAAPNSAFTAGYVVTFARVDELGVNKWTPSDFYGGLQGFLSSFDLSGHGVAFEDIYFRDNGNWQVKIGASGLTKVTDVESAAAQVWRLYDAILRRAPDRAGFDAHTAMVRNGSSLKDIATIFYNSAEFALSGANSLNNAQFVDWMYTNILHRPADAGNGWVALLNGGMSRVDALLGFSESAEHKLITNATLLANTWIDEKGLDLFSMMPTASKDGQSVTIDSFPWAMNYAGGYRFSNGTGAQGTSNSDVVWSANDGPMTLDDQHTEVIWQDNWQYDPYEGGWYNSPTEDYIQSDGGDDIFIGGSGGDLMYGRSGWDWLDGGAGDDVLYGGDQNDVLIGGAGNDVLFGEGGDDYLAAGDGADAAYGGAGADTLADGQGSECLLGEDGDDTFLIATDATFNWFLGGTFDAASDPAGKDTISAERMTVGVSFDLDYRPSDWTASHPDATAANAASRQAFVVNAVTGAWITSEGLLSVENATGSLYNDRLYGTVGDNVLKGSAGDDLIWGRGGNDTIEGGAGADSMAGEGDYDWLSYAGSSAGVYIDLSTGEAFGGDADGDVFSGMEAVRGSKFADQLKGYDGGDNWLDGGDGDDWLVATTGADVYMGGGGKDFVDYSAATSGVSLYLGGYTPTGTTNGYGYTGLAASQTYIGVEGVVGTAYGDSLSAGDGDQTFVGGAGNDSLAGGAGADTYVLNRGDGSDTVTEDNQGWNTFSFGENVKFSDLWIGASGGASGWLDVGVRGTSDVIRMVANFGAYPIAGNNKLKSIDLNGAAQLDVGALSFAMAGDDSANLSLYGAANRADLIFGYNGDDRIYGVQANQTDQTGDVFVGGLGNDSLYGSGGDDQYAYDRGDGVDAIIDVGGEDTLVFGSTVAAEDVIYEVVGNDLYIGAKDATNAALTASQVADRVRIAAGGVQWVETDPYGQETGTAYVNGVEYVIAGGTSIDLRKLDINWTRQTYVNYDNYYPIALDLDGDGLNLSSVDGSSVVVKTAQGGLSKIGWVGPTDGFLAVDRNGDGAINTLSEISFVQDKPGATSDLEGLRTWDTNGDGVLDKADKDFSKILLFVDANQNGRSTAKELRTLEEAGIVAINLGGTATGYTREMTTESFVQNTLSFVWADGRTGAGYDVALARRVLGSEGLYAGEYQAEWGARDEDGVLGQLLNDPKTAAKAARIKAKKGLLDKLGATYAEVKAAAQVDFSDHDKVDAAIAKRWKKMDASQQAAWLSGQASGMDGQKNLAGLKAISSQQSLSNALRRGAQAGSDLVAQGLTQAATGVSAGAPASSSSAGGQGAPGGLGVDFGVASSGLGGVAAGEPVDGLVSSGAGIGQDQAWWRGETGDGLAGAGSLAALLAAMDQGPGGSAPDAGSAGEGAALLQQQMLLRQAMAGFGGQTGGSAAIWNRDAAQASSVLAAAGQTNLPAATNLALAS